MHIIVNKEMSLPSGFITTLDVKLLNKELQILINVAKPETEEVYYTKSDGGTDFIFIHIGVPVEYQYTRLTIEY